MDEKELTRRLGEPLVICQYPDVCLSPTAPAPYLITAHFDAAYCTADTVNATGAPSFTMASFLPTVQGDEAGSGGGMMSATFAGAGVCWPVGASTTVRAKGSFVVRHEDPVMMNNGNVPGLVHYPKGGAPAAEVNAAREPSVPSKPAALVADNPLEGNFFTGLGQSMTETLESVGGKLQTLSEATGIGVTQEVADAARGAIYDGAVNAGGAVVDGAVGTAGFARDVVLTNSLLVYESEAGLLAAARVSDLTDSANAAIDAGIDRYATAAAEGGGMHALGLLTGDAGQLLIGGVAGGAVTKAAGGALTRAAGGALTKAKGALTKLGALPDVPGKVPMTKVDDLVETRKVGVDGTRVKISRKGMLAAHDKRRSKLTDAERDAIAKDKAKISELSAESDQLRKAGDIAGADAKLAEAQSILEPHVAKGDAFAVMERLDVSTAPDKGFLWSGNADYAKQFADAQGANVLETTLGGRVVDNWDVLKNSGVDPTEFWDGLSDKYASQLSGHVTNLQTAERALEGGGGIFRGFELPQIQAGQVAGRVTGYTPLPAPPRVP